MNTGENKLGNGTPNFCNECDKPYREIQRLPGLVGYCPKCFEKVMNSS